MPVLVHFLAYFASDNVAYANYMQMYGYGTSTMTDKARTDEARRLDQPKAVLEFP